MDNKRLVVDSKSKAAVSDCSSSWVAAPLAAESGGLWLAGRRAGEWAGEPEPEQAAGDSESR